jgi:hypothetical protein
VTPLSVVVGQQPYVAAQEGLLSQFEVTLELGPGAIHIPGSLEELTRSAAQQPGRALDLAVDVVWDSHRSGHGGHPFGLAS